MARRQAAPIRRASKESNGMAIDVHAHYWTNDYVDLLVDLGKKDSERPAG